MVKKSSCFWFDKRILVLLIACYIQNVTSFWEYAVCTYENIMLFDSSWKQLNNTKFSIEQDGFKLIKSITYDVNNDVFYFANNQKPNVGIFKLKVHNESSYEISDLIKFDKGDIRDLIFDAFEDTLYWSDAMSKHIFRLKLNSKAKVEVETFLDVTFDVEGMLIDSCSRSLFFVRKYNEKMNVVSLNDPKREVKEIGVGNHDQPVAIAIDHQTRRIYVADVQGSVHYSIDSILTNGSDFRREVDSSMKFPRSIAVDAESVYYVDGDENELRTFSKEFNGKSKKSKKLMKFEKIPQDIIIRSNFVADLNSKLCKPKVVEVTTTTTPTTERKTTANKEATTAACPQCDQTCKIDRCRNFCLNNGECSIDKNEPKCSCNLRFAGDRCEVDLCTNFCFHGECSINKDTKQPQCKCKTDFTGERCEKPVEKEVELPPHSLQKEEGLGHQEKLEQCHQGGINASHVIVAVCVTFSLTIFLVILLVLKKMRRPMRPRVKKTFKVHKNIEPLTYRPTTEHCEVIIEDCCNMNICETPCYDPKTLQKEINESNLSVKLMPSSRCSNKDDKQDLLKHMEYNQ